MAASASRFLDPATLASLGDLRLLARTVVEGFTAGLHLDAVRVGSERAGDAGGIERPHDGRGSPTSTARPVAALSTAACRQATTASPAQPSTSGVVPVSMQSANSVI